MRPSPNLSQRERDKFALLPSGRRIKIGFKKETAPLPRGRGWERGMTWMRGISQRARNKCPHLTSPSGRGISLHCLPKGEGWVCIASRGRGIKIDFKKETAPLPRGRGGVRGMTRMRGISLRARNCGPHLTSPSGRGISLHCFPEGEGSVCIVSQRERDTLM